MKLWYLFSVLVGEEGTLGMHEAWDGVVTVPVSVFPSFLSLLLVAFLSI